MYAVRRRAVRNPFKILRRRKFSAYGAAHGGKMEPDASGRIAAKLNRKGEIMTRIELFLLLALLFAGAGCLLSLIALLRLGAPILLTQVGVIVVSFADTMMVGAYSTEALAAAAFVNNFFMVPMVMLMGFAAGLTPIIGSLYTRKRNVEVGRTLRAGLKLNTLMALLLVAVIALWLLGDFLPRQALADSVLLSLALRTDLAAFLPR